MNPSLLRVRGREDSSRVGMVELFFDLVFVYAVTQLSHSLLAHLDLEGAVRVLLLMLAVWAVWIDTSWVTNWLDPERIPVRIAIFVLSGAGLLVSIAIPNAFTDRGLLFGVAIAFMQVGRTLFFLWAVRGGPLHMRRNFQRILAWFGMGAVFWVTGGMSEGNARFGWWVLALLMDMGSPWVYFWVPGLGRSTTADWDVDGGHLSERCALFIMIALGESLLVTGATFADLKWDVQNRIGFTAAILGTILMWWIYFDTGAERAHHRITHTGDAGRIARAAYTYLHVPMVAGIIVCAVAYEVMLAHPEDASDAGIAAILGGPACYLAGAAWFKWVTNDRRAPPLSHMVGLGMLALLAGPAFGHRASPLELGVMTVIVLGAVAFWEALAVRRAAPPRR